MKEVEFKTDSLTPGAVYLTSKLHWPKAFARNIISLLIK